MIDLRPYQRASIDALYDYFMRESGNPLIVLPTGTGKSVVIAEFIRGVFEAWADSRVMMLTHVRELIAQNYAALVRHWPDAPAGIYSAGLGRKDVGQAITCAGIQSIWRRAYTVQRCDLIIVDEAHLIPRDAGTMYGKFLADMRQINPALKIIGFTATPYRLDSGMLHQGEGRMFDSIAYEMSILEAIQQGYLTEVRPKEPRTKLDVSKVGTYGGEFIQKQLEAAVDVDEITRAAVEEIVAHGQDRGSWLVFCAGVRHAWNVRDAIRERGISCEAVTGETPGPERDRILGAFKSGALRAITNMSVLTTGFDAPGVDLIAALRPTKSAGLWVQMVGRGTRLASGKDDCLLLDFAGNCRRHGPIDRIKVSAPGESEGNGEAPVKVCPVPECSTIVATATRVCPNCGHEFPAPKPKLAHEAATDAVLSTQIRDTWCDVSEVRYALHAKMGGTPSMRVEYLCGMVMHREWICVEHAGYARQKAVSWWQKRAPGQPVPKTVAEALLVADSLSTPRRIAVRPAGKYTEIVRYDW
jgi:DNA repair protein RadD